jgi:hypothetical protein
VELIALTEFLDRLDEADIHYSLSSLREAAVMVSVSIPGERWEVEFMSDGEIEVEIFSTDGEIYDESMFDELFERNENNTDDE